MFGDGEQSRGWTYVDDVVEATILAMERGSGTYNVGGGVEASLREAIGILEGLAGRSLEIREQPAVPGDQRRTNADTTRIRSERRLGAEGLARGRLAGTVGMGFGYSRRPMSPDSEPQRSRAGGGAGGRLRAIRADHRRALVAARHRRCARRAHRLPRLALGREDLQGDGAGLPRPAAGARLRRRRHHLSDDTRARPGLRHERGCDRDRRRRRRPAAVEAARPGHRASASGNLDHQAGLPGAAALDSGHGLRAREDGGRCEQPRPTGRGRGGRVHDHEDRDARAAARVHRHPARARERAPRRPRARRSRRSSTTAASAPSRSSSR